MAVFKPKTKETIEDRLQRAINLGRSEALKEVLKWLDETFWTHEDDSFDFIEDLCTCPVWSRFDSKEELIQSFQERFYIE